MDVEKQRWCHSHPLFLLLAQTAPSMHVFCTCFFFCSLHKLVTYSNWIAWAQNNRTLAEGTKMYVLGYGKKYNVPACQTFNCSKQNHPCARSFCKDVLRPGARSGKSSVKSWYICWYILSWLSESQPGGSQSRVAKSKPPDYSKNELGMNQHVAKREPSLAFMLSSQPGVNPLPHQPCQVCGTV